jgi:hypothetical protein
MKTIPTYAGKIAGILNILNLFGVEFGIILTWKLYPLYS